MKKICSYGFRYDIKSFEFDSNGNIMVFFRDSNEPFSMNDFNKDGPTYKLFSDIQHAVNEYYRECRKRDKKGTCYKHEI